MKDDISKHSYIVLIAFIISSVLNYLYQIAMGVMLPKAQYGILGVALSVYLIASVLTQNTFSWSGTRRMASTDDPLELARTFRTVLTGNLCLALIAAIAIITLSLGSGEYEVPNLIVGVSVILSAFVASFNSLVRARKKFLVLASANASMALLRLFVAVVLVLIGLGVVGALGGLATSLAIVCLYLYFWVRRLDLPPTHRLSFDMLEETLYVSITFIGVAYLVNLSIIFAKVLGCTNAVAGDFNASLTISRGVFFVTGALITVLFPYVSSESSKERIAFQSVKYFVLLVFPLCLTMAVNPKLWLVSFFGWKYVEGAGVLRILALGMGFVSLVFLLSSNMIAMEEFRVPALCLVFGMLLQMAIVAVFKRDPTTSSALSIAVASFVVLVLILRSYVRGYYFKATPSHLIRITIAYATLTIVFSSLKPVGRITSILETSIAFTIYAFVLTLLRLFDERDVEVLLSPLPRSIVERIGAIVRTLNGVR